MKPDGTGTLMVTVSDLAEFKSALAHLAGGAMLFGPDWHANHLLLRREAAPPGSYPATIAFFVQDAKPENAVREYMVVSSPFLPGMVNLRTYEYRAPVDGGEVGFITVACDTLDDYLQALQYLREPHGSMLRAYQQAADSVYATRDDAAPKAAFPQKVTFDLEWRFAPE